MSNVILFPLLKHNKRKRHRKDPVKSVGNKSKFKGGVRQCTLRDLVISGSLFHGDLKES